jgi:hypothetical protein
MVIEILISLMLVIIYLGFGFLYAYVGEVFLFSIRVENKNAKEDPSSQYPLRSRKIRFQKVLLWPFFLEKYLREGLY